MPRKKTAPNADPKPVRGELRGVIYDGADLEYLINNGLQRELEGLIVTYDDGSRIRPFRFCDTIVSISDDGSLIRL